jgi:hypothetical protein
MSAQLRSWAHALGGEISGNSVRAPGPGHSAGDRSLSVTPSGASPIGFLVHSFAGDDPLVCLDYVRAKLGLPAFAPQRTAPAPKCPETGEASNQPEGAKQVFAASFDYRDETGNLLFQTVRFEFQNSDGSFVLTDAGKRKKTFRQRRPNPDRPEQWLWNLDGVALVPYRLPELIEAAGNETLIVIAEGERKVDLLRGWNIAATCNSGGAKKWRAEHSAYLKDANVVIMPDNDPAGRKHLDAAAASLKEVGAAVRVLNLPGLSLKDDVLDWAAAGGTVEQLYALIDRDAKPWKPSNGADTNEEDGRTGASLDREITRLSKLSTIEYEHERKTAPGKLGVRAAILDKLVKDARPAETGQGRPLELPEPEPWASPVDGGELISQLTDAIRRYVVLNESDTLAVSLWVLHAYCFELFMCTPRLAITSPEKRCGKTTLLDVLACLLPRPLSTANISSAATFRTVEAVRPTLLIDEATPFSAKTRNCGESSIPAIDQAGRSFARWETILSRVLFRHTAPSRSHKSENCQARLRTGASTFR